MQGSQIAIVLVAAVVAFGAAFGIGKVTSKTDAAGSGGKSLESVTLATAPSLGSVTTGAALPSLKAPARKPKPDKPKDNDKPAADTTPSATAVPTRTAAPVVTSVPTANPTPAPTKPPVVGGGNGSGEKPVTGGSSG